MALFHADPFDTLFQFQQALDGLRSSNWLEASPSGGGAYPPLNLFRKGDDVIIITEVPGVNKADLLIEAKGDTIRIAGRKNAGPAERGGGAGTSGAGTKSVHRLERRAGRFDRTITLPIQIDADRIRAECRDGILALHVPRAAHDKPRSIPIG